MSFQEEIMNIKKKSLTMFAWAILCD
jgi:hypothetical protein